MEHARVIRGPAFLFHLNLVFVRNLLLHLLFNERFVMPAHCTNITVLLSVKLGQVERKQGRAGGGKGWQETGGEAMGGRKRGVASKGQDEVEGMVPHRDSKLS
jgi:hypothetical protein